MDAIVSSAYLRPMDIMSESENRTLQDKFMLRLPDGMRERIKAVAEANNRSMNSEIVATLEEKYPAPRGQTLSEVWKRLEAMREAAGDDPEKLKAAQVFENRVANILKEAIEAAEKDPNARDAKGRLSFKPEFPPDL